MKYRKTGSILKKLLAYGSCSVKSAFVLFFGVLIASVAMMVKPRIISNLTDKGFVVGRFEIIVFWCLILVCISLVVYLNEIIQIRIFTRISNDFTKQLYQAALNTVLKAPYRFLQQRSSAEVFSTINGDVERISLLMERSSLIVIRLFFQMIGGAIGIFLLEWRVAIVVMLVIPIKQVVEMVLAKRKTVLTDQYIHEWQNFSEWFGNQTSGIVEIKLWNLYSKKEREFVKKYKKLPELVYQMEMCDGIETLVGEFSGVILEVIVYLFCGWLLCRNQMSIGNVLAFLSYVTYISSPLSVFTNIPYLWAQIKPAAERYLDMLDWPSEELESISEDKQYGKKLILENVSFGYSEEKSIIKNLNLTVEEGEKIAIIGENGSGKTTLMNLILGIYLPDHGEIFLGQNALGTLGLTAWRERFAVVGQRPYLFQGSVKSNIDVYDEWTLQELGNLSKMYGLSISFQKISEGLNYQIADNGTNLSGGEKQKIAFLRAMIKDADIIILDEAFSNCDEESRKIIRNIVFAEDFSKTVILVSHYREDRDGISNIYELRNGALNKIDRSERDCKYDRESGRDPIKRERINP